MERIIDKMVWKITNIKGKPINYEFQINEELEMGVDYTILMKGRVYKEEALDNNDGTVNVLYKLAIPELNIQLIPTEVEKVI